MLRRVAAVFGCLFSLFFCVGAEAHHSDNGVFFFISSAPPPPPPQRVIVPSGRWECANYNPMAERCMNWAWVPVAYWEGPPVEYYPAPYPYHYHHHRHPHYVY